MIQKALRLNNLDEIDKKIQKKKVLLNNQALQKKKPQKKANELDLYTKIIKNDEFLGANESF